MLLLSLLFISSLIATTSSAEPEQFLNGLIDVADKRYSTFYMAFKIMLTRGLKTIVETGTARDGARNCGGDGCSTVVLSRFVQAVEGASLNSVDISEQAVISCRAALPAGTQNVTVHQSDSVEFLKNFSTPIDFLYLDSYDFDGNDPLPSQEHHLREIIAAYNNLHHGSLVMVDDCALPHGGKCRLAELFLKELGWKVVMKGYQVLMVYNGENLI